MQTYGEQRDATRQQQFLTRRAGFRSWEFNGCSRGMAKARRRDKKILHRIARRTCKIEGDE